MNDNKAKRLRKLAYMRARNRNRVHAMIVDLFVTEQRELGMLKKDLARRCLRDPAQITRWLGAPGNMSLDVISDLLFAMGLELVPRVQQVPSEIDGHLTEMVKRHDRS